MSKSKPRQRRSSSSALFVALIALISAIVEGCAPIPSSTPMPTAPPTRTPTPTETYAPTSSDTPIPTNTATTTPTPIPTPAPEIERTEARVVEVVDGDTIKVDIGGEVYTVRYIGIDTPIAVHPSEPVEWLGPEASEANKRLVEGQMVYLEKDVSETDQYGRLLRYVYLADGTCVNAEMVRQGYAQVSTYPPDVRYQELFLEMKEEARENEHGLWQPPTPSCCSERALSTLTPRSIATATPRPTLPTAMRPSQPMEAP